MRAQGTANIRRSIGRREKGTDERETRGRGMIVTGIAKILPAGYGFLQSLRVARKARAGYRPCHPAIQALS